MEHMTIIEAERLISPAQAALLLALSPARIRQMCDKGTLPCEMTALGRLIPRGPVEELARQRRQDQQTKQSQ